MVAIDYSSVSNVHRIIRLNTTTQRLKPVLAITVSSNGDGKNSVVVRLLNLDKPALYDDAIASRLNPRVTSESLLKRRSAVDLASTLEDITRNRKILSLISSMSDHSKTSCSVEHLLLLRKAFIELLEEKIFVEANI